MDGMIFAALKDTKYWLVKMESSGVMPPVKKLKKLIYEKEGK